MFIRLNSEKIKKLSLNQAKGVPSHLNLFRERANHTKPHQTIHTKPHQTIPHVFPRNWMDVMPVTEITMDLP
jgi:hypothetical protein